MFLTLVGFTLYIVHFTDIFYWHMNKYVLHKSVKLTNPDCHLEKMIKMHVANTAKREIVLKHPWHYLLVRDLFNQLFVSVDAEIFSCKSQVNVCRDVTMLQFSKLEI